MSGLMGWFSGRKNTRESTTEAIVGLRQTLLMLQKKEEYLQRQIDEAEDRARKNATTNKRLALTALRQKKAAEADMERIAGTRLTIEAQVNTIESANLNAETMLAMKKGAEALKGIHSSLNIDKVDQTMDSIREQMDVANEISEAISNPTGMGNVVDEDELKAELEALEQEELDDRLKGADRVPIHTPASPIGQTNGPSRVTAQAEEDDEEAQLRQLQAELAM
ncbi:vacuolar-sorting protein SNF7 [Tremella mesenterica]|uniref:Vacuolar-sorting protein SNF7 n=1 Tax=Tremella mesenterica TaxID=5217 RepID=A0A4Q1BR67_TREME|nr:uncharacterized protein TREMEDRAFT_40846 [Tremella mesenterica DSM 1558]EIW66541.1 hypothetical protein TREMEDRAFT_40846 [Tremella mesenterica DSM 1558]RXK40443.1 vacuolar-sorting protein SNF7 [Tremella mesenterica]